MDNLPRQQLAKLIKDGRDVYEPKKCKAMLLDMCGNNRAEISALIAALEYQVVDHLTNKSCGVPSEIFLATFAKQLQNNSALSEEAAKWAVESWALILGIVSEDDLVTSEQIEVTNNSKLFEYTLTVTLGSQTYHYSIDLSNEEENNPDIFFTKQNGQQVEKLTMAINNNLNLKLQKSQVQSILNRWYRQIKLGYRTAYLDL